MPENFNIKTVYAMINKQKVVAKWDEELGKYVVEATAPSESSWNQPGHVYEITLHAEDKAGNTVMMDSSDEEYGDQLKLRVLEKTAPTAQVLYPTTNSVIGKNVIDIKLRIKDSGGSGLNMSTAELVLNGASIKEGLSWTDGTDGEKNCTYTTEKLSDGQSTVQVKVQDNDGNKAESDVVTFVVSTAAPSLDIISPAENLITNGVTVTVSGETHAGNTWVTIESVTVNEEPVDFDPDEGTFTTDVTITDGENHIIIVATDSAGNSVTVDRKVTLDRVAPIITDVKADATTVDASGKIRITFKVIES